jgi:hypothetical protein
MNFIVRLARLADLEDLQKLNEEFNGVAPSLLVTSTWTDDSSEIVAIGYVDDNAIGFDCEQSFVSFSYNSPQEK